MKGLLTALIVLALILAGVVSAQDEAPAMPAEEVVVEQAAPVVTIPIVKVESYEVPMPRYIRLDSSVDCTPTTDGGLFCIAAPAEE